MGNSLIKAQELPTLLKLYCPDLVGEAELIKSWMGDRLKDYTPEQFNAVLKASLAEIAVLTGGTLAPKDSQMFQVQLKVIGKFVLGSFGFLTAKEFVNAFYLNCEGKFGEPKSQYGRDINSEYIGTVLTPYIAYKKMLETNYGPELKKVLLPPSPVEQKVLTEEDYIHTQRESVQMAYARFLDDLDLEVKFYCEFFYDVLVKDGFIEPAAYEMFLTDAKNKEAHELHLRALHDQENDGQIGRALRKLRQGKVRVTVTVAKQMAVKEFFLIAMRKGKTKLYEPA
jgi:hypothetical protein